MIWVAPPMIWPPCAIHVAFSPSVSFDHLIGLTRVFNPRWDVQPEGAVCFSPPVRVYIQTGRRGGWGRGKEPAVRPSSPSPAHICASLLFPQPRDYPRLAGIMDARVGLSFLILLIMGCICCDGRSLETSDTAVLETLPRFKTEHLEEYERNKKFCTLCEHFAEQAMEYLKENKTQEEIIETFHHACDRLPSFQQQCVTLVDYYAPVFFIEVSSVHPHDFCRRINLCEDTAPPPHPPAPSSPPSPSPLTDPLKGEHICDFCHNAVFKVLAKLKDPGTELRIVERLVKGCVVAERFAEQCQTLIFQYGPVILVNVVRLLERADLCVSLHACQGNRNETIVPHASSMAIPLHDM